MATGIRINHAKNFAGKSYVVTTEISQLLNQLTLDANLKLNLGTQVTFADSTEIGGLVADLTPVKNAAVSAVVPADMTANQIVLANAARSVQTTGLTAGSAALAATPTANVLATEKAVKDYVDGRAVNVTAGPGVTIDTTTATSPKISADVDGKTVVLSGTGDAAKLATGLTLAKLATATTGFAASYQLQDAAGTRIGATIDIVKDQFIKTAEFGWSTATDSTGAGWTKDKSTTAKYPCIKLELYANDNGASNDDTAVTTLYIPLNDVFADKTAGNYIDATALASNEIKVNVGNGIDATNTTAITVKADTASEKVYTAKNTSAAVLSVGTGGVKVANVQAAINYAVGNEHAKAADAVTALDNKIDTVQGAASGAVSALNKRVEDVAASAATAVANVSSNLHTEISNTAANAQTAIQAVGAAVDALDGKVATAITSMNTNVEKAIDDVVSGVNTALDGTVSSVNAKVSAAVSSVNAQVSSFKDTVNTTLGTVATAVDGAITDAVAARTTQLTNAVQVVELEVTATSTAASSGVATATVNASQAKYILAVYDATGVEIYPEITRNSSKNFTLTADFGSATSEKWNVICVQALPALGNYDKFAANGYKNTVAYTDATVSSAAKTAVDGVDADDVSYTSNSNVGDTTVAAGTAGDKAITVANGTSATAPAKQADVTKAAPDYSGYSA